MNHALNSLVDSRTTSILDGLISALDLRDTETQWHSRRVSLYARRLGAELGIKGEDLLDVEYGALLHDVGKIGIPDSILRKPAALTEEEWSIMRMHPRLGYELLRGIDFLKRAALVPLHHHEKFEGGGYPQKLKGEQIYIGARIFSVVDTLDAITTNRPYRRAREFAWAKEEIIRCNNTQFDPMVVEAFLKISEEEWKSIRETHIGSEER
jgi:HD-GYP domain-containing protein (c-di-GMP phosphodiesterase class II)